MLMHHIPVSSHRKLMLLVNLAVSLVYGGDRTGTNNQERWEKYFSFPAEPALNRLYDVLHYDINLLLQPDNFRIEGKNTILLTPRTDTLNQLSFDLEELQVDSVRYNHALVSFTHQNGELILTTSRILDTTDTVAFDIYYHGVPESGLYRRINSYGDTVIYSHNEPYDARYWFPCNDDPADKATHDLRVTMPKSYKVVSNGTLQVIEPGSQGWSTTHWQENYPVATYLISLAAARYQVLEKSWTPDGQNMPVMYFVYPQDVTRGLKALDATVDMLTFFSEYIGLYPFNLEKYAMVEVPFAEASAMENQTVTTMRDVIMDNEQIIAHELAHQWWGDAVTPASFADIWLNEGFASYFDVLYTGYRYGEDEFNRRMENYRSLIHQDGSLSYPIYNPPSNYLFGRAVYFKGAWILHMLREEVGDETFRDICRIYYEQYKYRNVTTNNFIQICEQVSQISLQTFFNQWLNYGGIPEIYLTWKQEQIQLTISLQQTQPGIIYDLDLEIKIQGYFRDSLIRVSSNEKFTDYQVVFCEPVQAVIVDPEKKILQTNNTPVYYLALKTSLLAVYPNPAQNEISIVYETDRAQQVIIEIWNMLGEKVKVLRNEKQNAGLYRYLWNEINLSSGTYFCILRAAGRLDVKKVVILR
jgi:aminopeptidase N